MYTLVLVAVLSTGDATADNKGSYPSMEACFEARDDILVGARAWDGFLKAGKQAVCVKVK